MRIKVDMQLTNPLKQFTSMRYKERDELIIQNIYIITRSLFLWFKHILFFQRKFDCQQAQRLRVTFQWHYSCGKETLVLHLNNFCANIKIVFHFTQ